MTDKEKLLAVRAEVENCYSEALKRTNILKDEYSEGKVDAFRSVLTLYDSLQKGPELANSAKSSKDLQEEPLSEEFRQFENTYLEKEKDEILCVYDRHAGLVDGAQWQKQQMAKAAVDGIAHPDDSEIWCNLDEFDLEDGDKVKIIIIKED